MHEKKERKKQMRKEELTKLYDHLHTTLLRQISITGVGYEAQFLLNGVFMLYQSRMISYKDFTNLNGYIIGIADDRVKTLNYERLKKNNEKV